MAGELAATTSNTEKRQELVTLSDAEKFQKKLENRGLSMQEFQVLRDVIHPNARNNSSVLMAFDYCKARRLDPFKRVVHVVPTYDSQKEAYVETIWPGISEVRTTAHRGKDFAGCDPCEFGPEKTENFVGEYKTKKGKHVKLNMTITYPEWAAFTVYKIVQGSKVAFPGPRVKWKEEYKTAHKDVTVPNTMWAKRPSGQIEKCAEAAALRRAWPEEAEYTAEEMQGSTTSDMTPDIEEDAVWHDSEDGEEGDVDAVEADAVVETKTPSEPQTLQERSDGLLRTGEFIDARHRTELYKSGSPRWKVKDVNAYCQKEYNTPSDAPAKLTWTQYDEVVEYLKVHDPA